jgi:hypothetical protein
VVADFHHFKEKLDPDTHLSQTLDPDPHKSKSKIRISIKVMRIRNRGLDSKNLKLRIKELKKHVIKWCMVRYLGSDLCLLLCHHSLMPGRMARRQKVEGRQTRHVRCASQLANF